MAISLILISRRPDVARFAVASGVDRIMVDLEVIGKKERQGHLDAVLSAHTLEDVERIASTVPASSLIVRTNMWHNGLDSELEDVLRSEPGHLMLPMVRSAQDVREYCRLVDGRANVIPLVETASGLQAILEITEIRDVDELFIGLNDLHLDLGMQFMFEPLQKGLIDEAVDKIKTRKKLRYGFGGIARMGEGLIPGRLVLSEHVRLGSSSVILSRTFHRRQAENTAMSRDEEFASEIALLRAEEAALASASVTVLEQNRKAFNELVNEISKSRPGSKS